MNINAIEILALILILIALIKIVIVIINPIAWLSYIEKLYSVPAAVSSIGFILSVLVLYFIIHSGVSILEVLAVCLFVALLMMMGLANYAGEFSALIKNQNISQILKKMWLYFTFWILLIIWGIYELITK